MKLKKIEDIIVKNKGKYVYNNNNLFKYKKITDKLFVGNNILNYDLILKLYNYIWTNNLIEINNLFNKYSDIEFADITSVYTKRNIFHLIIEKNMSNVLINFINIIKKQINNNIYNYYILNNNYDSEYDLINNENDLYIKDIKNSNKKLIFNKIIYKLLISNTTEGNAFNYIIKYDSYECLDILLNRNDLVPTNLTKKLFFTKENIFLSIKIIKLDLQITYLRNI